MAFYAFTDLGTPCKGGFFPSLHFALGPDWSFVKIWRVRSWTSKPTNHYQHNNMQSFWDDNELPTTMEPNVGRARLSSAHENYPSAPLVSFNSEELKAHF